MGGSKGSGGGRGSADGAGDKAGGGMPKLQGRVMSSKPRTEPSLRQRYGTVAAIMLEMSVLMTSNEHTDAARLGDM